jgi:hypothetical protein
MKETDKNIQDQGVKTSLAALASFVLSALLLVTLSPFFFQDGISSDMFKAMCCSGLFLSFCSAVSGIAALIQRSFGPRRLWWLGIVGIAVPAAWGVIMTLKIFGIG